MRDVFLCPTTILQLSTSSNCGPAGRMGGDGKVTVCVMGKCVWERCFDDQEWSY